jgi:hypothetical protein
MLSDQEIRSLMGANSKAELLARQEVIRSSISRTFPEGTSHRQPLLNEIDALCNEISKSFSTSFSPEAKVEFEARIGASGAPEEIKRRFYSYFDDSFWRAIDDMSIGVEAPLSRDERAELMEATFHDIISSNYAVGTPVAEVIANKGYGVARTIPVFSRKDYLVYFFCIKELECILKKNTVKTAFGGWGLSEGVAIGGQRENLEADDDVNEYPVERSFDPRAWSKVFGEFTRTLYGEIDRGQYTHVFQFDLSNYYDSIRLDTLERWIRAECGPEQCWVVTLLFYFLNQWNRKRTGLHSQDVGLPQDLLADCSRLLSSFYLYRYDQYASAVCSTHGAHYFRYADDQFVLLRNPSELERLVLLLTRRLDQYGLRVNQKKVRLWKCAEFERHRLRDLHDIFGSEGARQDSVRVSQYATLYLSLSLEQLQSSWNGGAPALTRLLWCDLGSLTDRQYSQIIDRLTGDDYLEVADSAKLRRIYALCGSSELQSWLVDRLMILADRLVHNSFHYHVLNFARSVDLPDLQARAKARIAELDALMMLSIVPVFEY